MFLLYNHYLSHGDFIGNEESGGIEKHPKLKTHDIRLTVRREAKNEHPNKQSHDDGSRG